MTLGMADKHTVFVACGVLTQRQSHEDAGIMGRRTLLRFPEFLTGILSTQIAHIELLSARFSVLASDMRARGDTYFFVTGVVFLAEERIRELRFIGLIAERNIRCHGPMVGRPQFHRHPARCPDD